MPSIIVFLDLAIVPISIHEQSPKDGDRRSMNGIRRRSVVKHNVEHAIDVPHLLEDFGVNRYDTTSRDSEHDTADRRRLCKAQQTARMPMSRNRMSNAERN